MGAGVATRRPWSGRSRGGGLGHLFFLWALRILGARLSHLFLYPVALYFVFAAPAARRASRAFLDAALGPEPNAWRRFWRTYRHLLTFARCLLDRGILLALGPGRLRRTSEGREHIARDPATGRGVLLLSAHLGNYEVGGGLLGAELPVSVVMVDAEAEAIKRVLARAGAKARGPRAILLNQGEFPSIEVLGALRAGEAVALHGDRVLSNARSIRCDFFGRPASFPTGPFLLAAAARAPVVLTFGLYEAPLCYRFVAEPPRRIELPRHGREQALEAQVRWYASRLEDYARRFPYQWFNFYDFWAPG